MAMEMDMDMATQAVEIENCEDLAQVYDRCKVGVLEWEGKLFPIFTGVNRLGREATACDIVFENEPSVSKTHAFIEATSDGTFFITDNKSLNGTYIGTVRIISNARYNVNDKSDVKVGTASIVIRKYCEEKVADLQDDSDDLIILLPTLEGENNASTLSPNATRVDPDDDDDDDDACTQFEEREILSATPEESTQFDEDLENKTNQGNDILDFDTQEGLNQSVQIKSTEKTKERILNMATQATYQNSYTKDSNSKIILELETQHTCRVLANGAQNVLEVDTQEIALTPQRKEKSRKDLLGMETQGAQSTTLQPVLDMETQPSVFVIPKTPVSIRSNKSKSPRAQLQSETNDISVLEMDTQSQLFEVVDSSTCMLDALTQIAPSVDKTKTNTSFQSDSESSLNIQYVDTEDSLLEHEELLANTTRNASILDIDTQVSPNVNKDNSINVSMLSNCSAISHSTIFDKETQNNEYLIPVATLDKNQDILNQSTQFVLPPANPGDSGESSFINSSIDKSNQNAKEKASIFNISTHVDNVPTPFDSYFEEADEANIIANNAVSKFLEQASQNSQISDCPSPAIEEKLVPDSEEDDQFFVPDTQDADFGQVIVPDTQDIAQEQEDCNSSTHSIIPESQDIDDFVENTPPSSPINNHKTPMSFNASINISQIETQLAPTFSQDTEKISMSQEATQIAPTFSQEQIPISQIETQVAPHFEDENIEFEETKDYEAEKKTQNTKNKSPHKTLVSISQVETQLAPTFSQNSEGTSVSQEVTKIAPTFSQEQIPMSQIETQVAPHFENEHIEFKERNKNKPDKVRNTKNKESLRKTLSLPSVSMNNISNGTQDVSISQVETQLAPTFDSLGTDIESELPAKPLSLAGHKSPLRPALRDPSPGAPRTSSLIRHVTFSNDTKDVVSKQNVNTPHKGVQTVKGINTLCEEGAADTVEIVLPVILNNPSKSGSSRKQKIVKKSEFNDEVFDFDDCVYDEDNEEPISTSTPKRTPLKRESRAKFAKKGLPVSVLEEDTSSSTKSQKRNQNTSKININKLTSPSKKSSYALSPSKSNNLLEVQEKDTRNSTKKVSEASTSSTDAIVNEVQLDNVPEPMVVKKRQSSRKSPSKVNVNKAKLELSENSAKFSDISLSHKNSNEMINKEDSANKRKRTPSKSRSRLDQTPTNTNVTDVGDVTTNEQSEETIENVLGITNKIKKGRINNAGKSNTPQKVQDGKNDTVTNPENLKRSKRNRNITKNITETFVQCETKKMNIPSASLSHNNKAASENKSSKAETPDRSQAMKATQVNTSSSAAPEVLTRTRNLHVETCITEIPTSSKQVDHISPIKSPQKSQNIGSKSPKRGRSNCEEVNQNNHRSKRSKSAYSNTYNVTNAAESDKQNPKSKIEESTQAEQETCITETSGNINDLVSHINSPQIDQNSSKQIPSLSSKSPKRGRSKEDMKQSDHRSKRSKSAHSNIDNIPNSAETNKQNARSKIKVPTTCTDKESTLKTDFPETKKLPQSTGASGLQQSTGIKTLPKRQAKTNHSLIKFGTKPVTESNKKKPLDVKIMDEFTLQTADPDESSKIEQNVKIQTTMPSKSKRSTRRESTSSKALGSTSNKEETAQIEIAAAAAAAENPKNITKNITSKRGVKKGDIFLNKTASIATNEDKLNSSKTGEVKEKSKKSITREALPEKTVRETRHHKKQQGKEPEPMAGPSGVMIRDNDTTEDLTCTIANNKLKESTPVFALPKLYLCEKRTRSSEKSVTETESKRTSKKTTNNANKETCEDSLPASKRTTRTNISYCISSEESLDSASEQKTRKGRQAKAPVTKETNKRTESESPSRSTSSIRSSVRAASISNLSGSESESLSSVMTNNSVMTERSARKTEKHKTLVLFSGYGISDKKPESDVVGLGGLIIDQITSKDCVLVVKNVTRTLKILTMLARGLPIVQEKWITDSKKSGRFLDPWNYLVKDKAYENKYQFSFKKCLEKRRAGKPVLEGYTIMATSNIKPNSQELKGVVENAGAMFIFKRPTVWPKPSLLVSCLEDKDCWAELRYDQFKNKHKPKIVKVDAIWETIQQQQVVTDSYELQ